MADFSHSFLKIEAAIEKLADISSDLKSMLAVHEQRLDTQEKLRDEAEDRFKEFEKKIMNCINETKQRITTLEKMIWVACGGGVVISWAITQGMRMFF